MRAGLAQCARVALACLVTSAVAGAAELKPIQLPKPQMEGGKPLMQALKERQTSRAFSDQKLSEQVLANLLWAADGVNRPDGKRTAPSAVNWQEVDIYVADYARMGRAQEADKDRYSAADTGFIAQNVYLFCASEGLAAVVRGMVGDKAALAEALKLRPEQKIILAHTVGYPKN